MKLYLYEIRRNLNNLTGQSAVTIINQPTIAYSRNGQVTVTRGPIFRVLKSSGKKKSLKCTIRIY